MTCSPGWVQFSGWNCISPFRHFLILNKFQDDWCGRNKTDRAQRNWTVGLKLLYSGKKCWCWHVRLFSSVLILFIFAWHVNNNGYVQLYDREGVIGIFVTLNLKSYTKRTIPSSSAIRNVITVEASECSGSLFLCKWLCQTVPQIWLTSLPASWYHVWCIRCVVATYQLAALSKMSLWG